MSFHLPLYALLLSVPVNSKQVVYNSKYLQKYKWHVFTKDSNILATSEGEISGKDNENVVLKWLVAKGKSSS